MEENKNQEKNEGHEESHKGHDNKKCFGFSCKFGCRGHLIVKIFVAVIIVFALLGIGAALGSRHNNRFDSFNRNQDNYFAPGVRGGEKAGGCALSETGGCGQREASGGAACAGCANANKQGSGEAGGCQFIHDQAINNQGSQAPGVNAPLTPKNNLPVPTGTQTPGASAPIAPVVPIQ